MSAGTRPGSSSGRPVISSTHSAQGQASRSARAGNSAGVARLVPLDQEPVVPAGDGVRGGRGAGHHPLPPGRGRLIIGLSLRLPTSGPAMAPPSPNPFGSRSTLTLGSDRAAIYQPAGARAPGHRAGSTACPSRSASCSKTPCASRAAASVTEEHVRQLGAWSPAAGGRQRRSPSCRPASSSRTSPACPAWSTWPPCGTRWRG